MKTLKINKFKIHFTQKGVSKMHQATFLISILWFVR